MKQILIAIRSALLLFIIYSPAVRADEGGESLARELAKESSESSETVTDPRLPPTIPGQEMIVGGKKVKVTSTAGPVPVARPPEPWREEQLKETRQLLQGGGVIVDERGGHHDHGHGDHKDDDHDHKNHHSKDN